MIALRFRHRIAQESADLPHTATAAGNIEVIDNVSQEELPPSRSTVGALALQQLS